MITNIISHVFFSFFKSKTFVAWMINSNLSNKKMLPNKIKICFLLNDGGMNVSLCAGVYICASYTWIKICLLLMSNIQSVPTKRLAFLIWHLKCNVSEVSMPRTISGRNIRSYMFECTLNTLKTRQEDPCNMSNKNENCLLNLQKNGVSIQVDHVVWILPFIFL